MTRQTRPLADTADLLERLYAGDGRQLTRISYYIDRYLLPTDVRGRHLLDVGGGDGSLGLYIRVARGARVDILDEYEGHGGHVHNRQKLQDRLEGLGVSDVQLLVGDVREIDLPLASYDGIYMRNTLHHIFDSRSTSDEDVAATLARVYQWLAPGGTLVIGEVGWMLAWRLLPPLRHRLFPNMQYASKSSFRRWRRCAERAGFVFQGLQWYVPYRLRRGRPFLGNEMANTLLTGSYVLRMGKP